MAAKDFFHDTVRRALEADGWTITDDPLMFKIQGLQFVIDLGAERIIAAERGPEQIAVEIKSFRQPSFLYEFHSALGQYETYRLALKEEQPQRILHLAVPNFVYNTRFQSPFIQRVLQERDMHVITFDPRKSIIEQWIR